MIEVQKITKRYGAKAAVDGLSFTVRQGVVTGFLGPNGSGKSTTMRMILGLDRPTSGGALVDGIPYAQHKNPLGALGALVDARAVHRGRSARSHLLALAAAAGVPRSRVREVIDMVGLREVARQRAGRFSLGMGQRLGIASALLGDPSTVMLDEPVNGLDPDGILWIRTLMRSLAAEGRAVLVSSHLMSEMAITADRLVVIGRGRLIADEDVRSFTDRTASQGIFLRCPQREQLLDLVAARGGCVVESSAGGLIVQGIEVEALGDAIAREGLTVYEMTPQRASLEEVFMQITADSVEFGAAREGRPALAASQAPRPDTSLVDGVRR